MTSLKIRQQAFGLLFVFVATSFFSLSLSAQQQASTGGGAVAVSRTLPLDAGGIDEVDNGKPSEAADPFKAMGCNNDKVTNQGFESGASDWETTDDAYTVSSATANEFAYSGSQSMKLDRPGATAHQSFAVTSGSLFSFSVFAKSSSTSGSFLVGVRFTTDDGTNVLETTEHVAYNSDFNNYTFDGAVPTNAQYATILLFHDYSTDGFGWIDEVCYEEKDVVVTNGGTPPLGFSASCGDNQRVDPYVSDVICGASPEAAVIIPNSGEVYQAVVEVVYKGQNPGQETYVTASDGVDYLVSKSAIQNAGNTSFHVYRGLIPTSVSGVTHHSNGRCDDQGDRNYGLQSLSVFAFRNTANEQGGSGVFTALTGYNNFVRLAIPIPTNSLTRDVTLQIPFSEVTLDGRYVTLSAFINGTTNINPDGSNADGIRLATETWTFGPADAPCCIDLLELEVPNVPGGVDEIILEVQTRTGQGPGGIDGQSYVLTGLAYADTECPEITGDCVVEFRAKGDCGYEQMELRLDGTTVETYTLTPDFQTYTFNGFLSGQDVEFHFVNDGFFDNGCDRNITLDYVKVGNNTYQTSNNASFTGCHSQDEERLMCDGKIDFGQLSCEDLVVTDGGTPPLGFSASCGDNQRVDPYVSDVICGASPEAAVTIPNSGEVYQAVVEVVYKGQNPGQETYVTASNGVNYLVSKVAIQNAGNTSFHVYRGLIPTSVGGVTHHSNGRCEDEGDRNYGLQSLSVFAFRNTANEQGGSGVFTALTGYNDFVRLAIPIPTNSLTRDVTLQIPFSEVTLDGRYVTLSAFINGTTNINPDGSNADGIRLATETWTFGPADGPCCIDLLELEVPNVPGGVDEIILEVQTRTGQGPGGIDGQSYVLTGLAYADTECPELTGDCVVEFRAKGDCGYEQMELRLDGTTVETYTLTPDFQTYTFNGFLSGQDVEFHFVNDGFFDNGCDRNITLDFVKVGDITYQTSSNAIFTGCHQQDEERLMCDGKIDFGPLSCCAPTDPGQITTDHFVACLEPGQTATPPTLQATAAVCPTGSPQYQWQIMSVVGGSWQDIAGATAQDYDPPAYGVGSRRFRRRAKCDCDTSFFDQTNVRDVDVYPVPVVTIESTDVGCDGGHGSITYFFEPDASGTYGTIRLSIDNGQSFVERSGTSGSYTFNSLGAGGYVPLFEWKGTNCPEVLDSIMIGTDAGPGVIAYCGDVELNKEILNTVDNCPGGESFPDRAVFAQNLIPGAFAAGVGTERYFWEVTGSNNKFEEFANGSARIQLTVYNVVDPALQMRFDVVLSGRTQSPPDSNSPKFGACINTVAADWYYYPTFNGTVTGLNDLAGMKLSITNAASALQVGTGANLGNSVEFGFSSWMFYAIQQQPDNGIIVEPGAQFDFNVNLSSKTLPMVDDDVCDPICAGESATIRAQGAGGTPGYSYAWSNGFAAQSITVNPTTTTDYTVTITDANGCTSTDLVTVKVNSAEWDNVEVLGNVDNCAGSCNGSIRIAPRFPATGRYFVEYTFGGTLRRFPATGSFNDASVRTIPDLCAGTYSNLTIVGADTGCRDVWPDEMTITEPVAPTVTVNDVTICAGDNAVFTASPAPRADDEYGYLWSTGATTRSITVANAQLSDQGDYSVTITDLETNCTTANSGNLNVRETPDATVNFTNPTCGEDNGTLTFTFGPQDGRTGIEFRINGSDFADNTATVASGSYTVSGLGAGTYELAVRWEEGDCPIDLEDVVLSDENGPVVTASGDVSVCTGGSVALTASATGGAGTTTYNWDQGGGAGASVVVSPTLTTTYTVTGQDANGCESLDVVTVTVVPDPNITIAANEHDFCTGGTVTLTSTVSGGLNCANVVWQRSLAGADNFVQVGTGAAFSTAELAVGQYEFRAVYVCAGEGCDDATSNVEDINIFADPEVTITITDDVLCLGESATITATPTGGLDCEDVIIRFRAGTSGTWQNVATGNTYVLPTDLAAGTYQYDARLVCGGIDCGSGNSNVVNVTIEPDPAGTVADQEACVGESATLTVITTVGDAPFTYAWSGDGGTNASATFSPAVTTTYTVTITDTNGCTGQAEGTVIVKQQPVAEITASDDLVCDGESVTFTATTTVDGTNYSWTFGPNAAPASALGPGPHVVTYTNSDATANVTSAAVLNVSRDGCTDSEQVNVTVSPLPKVEITAETDPTTCAGNDGSFTVDITTPGGSNAQISLDGGATYEACNQTTFTGLSAGVYDLRVRFCTTDCPTDAGTVTLQDPDAPVAEINGPARVCVDESLASTTVSFNATDAGTGATYTWNFGAEATPATATTRVVDNVSFGTTGTQAVFLTVTLNGCTATDEFDIDVDDAPQVSVTETTVCKGDDATLVANVTTGQSPFTYEWNNGETTSSINVEDLLVSTTFSVTVTDANGCSSEAQGNINVNPLPVPDLNDDITICAGEQTTLVVQGVLFSTAEPFAYEWFAEDAPDDVLSTTTELTVGPADLTVGAVTNFFVRVTDANGCRERDVVMVTVVASPTVEVEDAEICTGETATLTANTSGVVGELTYLWSTGEQTASIDVSPGATQSYSVTVTTTTVSSDGGVTECTDEDNATVTVSPLPDPSITGPDQACANEPVTFTVENLTPGATYNWTFDGPASQVTATGATVSVTYSAQGTYNVTLAVTSADGCATAESTTIQVLQPIAADAGDDLVICPGGSVTLDGSASFGTSFNWSVKLGDVTSIDGATTSNTLTVSPLFNTVYQLEVRDATGICVRVDEVRITIDANLSPTAVAGAPERLCNGTEFVLDGSESQPPVNDPTAELNYIWYEGTVAGGNVVGIGETVNIANGIDETTTYALLVVADGTDCGDTTMVTVNIVQCASLGDFAFLDEDGNGQQDGGEPGIAGVTVSLTNADATSVTDVNGDPVADVLTDADGKYRFDNLFPGDYILTFANPNTDQTPTVQDQGNDATDSDINPGGITAVINLGPGEDDLTNDAGYFITASLSDFVFLDADADGIQDADETGIPGVTVNLLVGGVQVATMTTDANGFYQFINLTPAEEYRIEFVAPTGFEASPQDEGGDDTVDSDADQMSGLSQIIVLASGENNSTIDAGFYQTASLGDYVWEDTNGNGINDEPATAGVGGVTVNLLDEAGTVIASTITGTNGLYAFTDLVPATYSVQFDLPAGFNFTTPNAAGSNETNDSDADPANNGETEQVTLVSGENDPDIDAGIQRDADISVEKTATTVEVQPDGSYNVTYTITITNNGGIGTYTVTDIPLFDDDVTILSGAYSGADAGAMNVTGPTVLTTDNEIAANAVETITVTLNVTIDLQPGSTDGGDNFFSACSEAYDPSGSTQNQGLLNAVIIDTNSDGQPDDFDSACPEVPAYTLDKAFVSATPRADGTYDVVYTITVNNLGNGDGSYSLSDDTSFDDDVIINGGSYSGNLGNATLTGVATLAAGTTSFTLTGGGFTADPLAIEAGGTHVWTVNFNVAIDLTDGSTDGGDNIYTECATGTPGQPGGLNSGLTNTAHLDVSGNGEPDLSDRDCGDLPGNVELTKQFVSATLNADGRYTVNYTVTVTQTGGVATTYDLTDTPNFDDDITIVSGTFSGEESGTLNTTGTTTLATGNTITSGATEVYNLSYTVTIDLTDGSDGDNVYTACDPGTEPGGPANGLENTAELTKEDGTTLTATDCGELPAYELDKEFVSATIQPDGSHNVVYTIAVSNLGGADGQYDLFDTPTFDDDVTILSGAWSGQNLGTLNTTGSTQLADDMAIAAGATHNYTLVYNVTLDLTPGSTDGGDNIYTVCNGGSAEGVTGTPATGLYNRADLDLNNDGTPDLSDDDCGELPDITLDKEFVSATPLGDGTYDVVYTIDVTNNGGAQGAYGLRDTPQFDDDVVINGGTYTGEASGTLNLTGATVLTTANTIAAGATESFELTYNVTLDLEASSTDGGDNIYTECTVDSGNEGVTGTPATGLNNRADLDVNGDNDYSDVSDDDCGDLPLFDLALDKNLAPAPAPYSPGSDVTYTVTVTNQGGIDAANVEVTDTPESGLTFQSIDPQAGITSTGNGSFTIAVLPAGGSLTVTLNYVIDVDFTGVSLNNAAEITEDGPYDDVDSNPEDGPDTDENGDGDPDDDDEDNVDLPIDQVPGINVEKATFDPFTGLFMDADQANPATNPAYIWSVTSPAPTVQWQYVVTNTGTQNLVNVTVTDDVEGVIGTIAFLAVGESRMLTASAPAVETGMGVYENIATATGQPVDPSNDPVGDPVTDTDPSHYVGARFSVEKQANTAEACEGAEVDYTVTVRLQGQTLFGLTAEVVMVTDTVFSLVRGTQEGFDLVPLLTADSDPNGNMIVDNDEEWRFEYSRILTEDTRNTAYGMFSILRNGTNPMIIAGDSSRTVTINAVPVVVVANVNPDGLIECNGDMDGSLTATVTAGGSGDFTYEWGPLSGNQVGPRATGLSAGIEYTVTVTDNVTGCFTTETGMLTRPDELMGSINSDTVLCFGDADGQLVVTAQGGTAPYTYAWSANAGAGNVDAVMGLAPGEYDVTVTDDNGCTLVLQGTVTGPDAELTAALENAAVGCFGDADGELTVVVSGGTADYTITWNTTPEQTGVTATGLVAGTYTATIGDANGCEVEVIGTIAEPIELVASGETTDVGCNGDATGTITLTVTGGTGGYTYAWAGTGVDATAMNQTGLTAGNYDVTVTDANGCTDEAMFTINESSTLTASIEPYTLACFGDEDGELTVGVSGGTGPYTITWNTTPERTGATANGLTAGAYEATIEDANGCELTVSGTVSEPTDIVIDETIVMLACNETNTGSITLEVSGGTGEYTYEWTGPGVDEDAVNQTDLVSGNYAVTVTDANGCAATDTYLLEPAALLVASVSNDSICTGTDELGELSVVIEGGSGEYTITWSTTDMNGTVTDLTAGDYTVTVTDNATGCTATTTGSVLEVDDVCNQVGNYVWFDANNDGLQDDDEFPAGGVTVQLFNADGTLYGEQVTDASGFYLFTSVPAGNYYIASSGIPVPADLVPFTVTFPNVGDNDAIDSDIDTLTAISPVFNLENGESDLSWDIGFVRSAEGTVVNSCVCQNDATTGDDGRFSDELQVTGIPGDVYTVVSQTGMFLASSPAPPAAQDPVPVGAQFQVGPDGQFSYLFYHLNEVGYSVVLENLSGQTLSISNTCEYPTIEVEGIDAEYCLSDDPSPVTIDLGQFGGVAGTLETFIISLVDRTDTIRPNPVNGIDPGLVGIGNFEFIAIFTPDDPEACINYRFEDFAVSITGDCAPAALGDFVWEDTNGNGVQDDGEPGVPGITVNLQDEDGNVIGTTTTNATGFYSFTDLVPGTYSVQFILPDGREWTTLGAAAGANEDVDSDADPAMDGRTEQVTITAGDFFDDLDAGILPIIECELNAEVTVDPVCNDNGTPTNPDDDFYTVTILVTGQGGSETWVSSILDDGNQPISGQLGVAETFTFDVIDLADADDITERTITFVDNEDVTCTATATFLPTTTCSNECDLNVSVTLAPYCDDNGTDFDPNDDLIFLGITVISENATSPTGWTAFNADGEVVGAGLYGEEDAAIGPFTVADLDADNNVTFTVEDNDTDGCNATVTRFIPDNVQTCSSNCLIVAEFLGSLCNPFNTTADPSDDVWYAEVSILGFNGTSRYVTNLPGGDGPRDYNGYILLGPFTTNGNVNVEIDNFNGIGGDCGVTLTLTPPETFPCSDQCGIDGELLAVYCDDNGTPADSLDDVFFLDVTATALGNNGDQGFVVREGFFTSGPIVAQSPVFGATTTSIALPIFDDNGVRRTDVRFRIEDATDPDCRIDTVIAVLPASCSDDEPMCDLELIITETICNDQGTPNDGSDDTYDFVLLATGANGTFTIEFTTPAGLMNMTGTFGQEETFGPIPASSSVNGTVIPDDGTCMDVGTFFVQAEGPCSSCQLDVTVTDPGECLDQGTADPSDDVFFVTVDITGMEGESGYLVEVPYQAETISGALGDDGIVTATFGPFNVADGDVTLLFRDIQFPDDCFAEVTFSAPDCETTCNIGATIVAQTDCQRGDDEQRPDDDFFTVTVNVTAIGTSDTWQLIGGDLNGPVTGNYGEDTELTFAAGTEDLTLVFVDDTEDACATELTVTVPGTCSDDSPCAIEAEIVADATCDANGEGYTFTLLVTDNGQGSDDGWTANGGIYTGQYGIPTEIDVTDNCGGLTLEITDTDDAECGTTMVVTTPIIGIVAPADTSRVRGIDLICTDGDEIFGLDSSLALVGNATTSGCGIESVTFVDSYLTGGPDGGDHSSCDEIIIQRVFTAVSCGGAMVSDTQLITIRKPLVTDVIFPTDTIGFDCGGAVFPTDENGHPTVEVTGLPAILTAFGDTTIIDAVFCGTLTVDYNDVSEQTCSGTQTIFRTWTAIDECTPDTLTSTQVIRTGDFSAPIVNCPVSNHYCPILEDDIMLFPMDHFDCVATFDVPLPDVTDVCSDSWTILTEVIDNNGIFVRTILDGNDRNVVLEAGDYTIRYTVTDDCGNTGVTDCIIRVADTQEPAAICISDINISVGGYGIARIYGQMIDIDSYDNCSIDSVLVRRRIFVDPVTGDSLAAPTWTTWNQFTEVDCNDAGSSVTLQLRVVDGSGNANVCTTTASVIDNTLPYCTGLDDLFISCTDLPDDFDANDTLSLQAAFGVPVVIDNCAAQAIELDPIVEYDECGGEGRIIRRWLAVDKVGNVSALEFTQVIDITADMGFTLVIPRDTLTACLEEAQGFGVFGLGCADISVSYVDSLVEANDREGEACLVIERKYTVINNCTFDPLTSDRLVISRDEDCDGEEGESVFYAIVDADSTYIDVDTSRTNAVPVAGVRGEACDGETNPTGYLRRALSTGAWTYTQRIAIIDDTRPELLFEAPDVFCATEMDSCLTLVDIPVTVAGECTAVGSTWLILVDLGRDGSPERSLSNELAIQGEFPNYFIRAELPIGEHNLMLRYVDGCNNATIAAVPFEVVDCSIPDPTCYSGLIAELEELETPDTTETGELIEVGVIVDAGRLASCDIDDCSGPLRFSVNRPGDKPSVDDTEITLTCDDRYRVELEVYMWDSAFNPLAMQPDSSIGGPNWKMCLVEVFVQDPNERCPDCSADGTLTLGGNITTARGVVLPNVEVALTGSAAGFDVTEEEGRYAFPGIESGDYTITPYREDDASNGLSTLDALILQQHLLGNFPITDPYVWLAADLNGSGTVTVLDRLLLQNIILGNTEVLPNGETWRFLPAGFVEEMGAEMARSADAPRVITLDNVAACSDSHDFIGIKLGDLNGSVYVATSDGVILNGTRGRTSNDTHGLEIEEHRLLGGERFELPVRSGELAALAGMQFSLRIGAAAEIVEVVPGLLTADYLGLTNTDRGVISANWTQVALPTDDEAVLFTIHLRGVTETTLSELIALNDYPTRTEAYRRTDKDLVRLTLGFTDQAEVPYVPQVVAGSESGLDLGLTMDQNFPNPFDAETTIDFRLPRAGEATISVYDLSGRVLKDVTGHYAAGVNSVTLRGDEIGNGVMIYTLSFEGERRMKTMIRNK